MLRIDVALYFSVAVLVVGENARRIDSRLVHTAQGPVLGYKDAEDDVYIFYNIPYATAPTGPNKFKAPLPPPTWSAPFEAIDRGIVCPQDKTAVSNKQIEEDCLVANIHVPNTEAVNLPVIVLVHGGAFQLGYGNNLIPNKFVETKNVIAVTFNYRLGIHGFLCLGTEDAPGNAGMKDQVALLRWVKQNIESFGGNPKDVTIVGCSAGSVSVDLLMLSKTTEGLFNKVITGSGTSISVFAVQIDPLETAINHARVLNCTETNDIGALGKFYKTASMDTLLLYSFMEEKDSGVVFAPCVERDTGVEIFLGDAPMNILKRGDYIKVPIIYGVTNMEGLLRLPQFYRFKDEMNHKFSDFLPADLEFKTIVETEAVAQTIKEFYFGDQPVSENNILSYIDYFSDIVFTYSMLWTVKFHIANGHNQVYLYEYSFVDEDISIVPYTNIRGADHCDQHRAFLDGGSKFDSGERNITMEYKNLKTIIRDYWYNFITLSKPVPEGSSVLAWPPVRENGYPYMSLGQKVELRSSLLDQRARFWDDIYPRYYRTPIPPLLTTL